MKLRRLIVIFFIVFLLVLFYHLQEQSNDKMYLFSNEDITHTNIEEIQIHKIHTNNSKVVDNKESIEKFSSFLRELNSEKIDDAEDNIEPPIYHIYIVNIGRYPHPPISIYKDSIVFRGKKQYITSEESSSLFQIIDEF